VKWCCWLTIAVMMAGPAGPVRGDDRGQPSGDWPQWRGPDRNGLVRGGPALADAWPTGGPRRVWLSEPIVGGPKGGYGSVSVAGGRAYVFASPQGRKPVVTRTLDRKALESLGWTPFAMPAPLVEAVEKARLSAQRAALAADKRLPWVERWIKQNVPAPQASKHRQVLLKRLMAGRAGLPPATLDKLGAIKDRTFPDAAHLARWLDAQGIAGRERDVILRAAPTRRAVADDVLYCLSTADGRTLWKKTCAGTPHNFASSCTPLLAGGRCYFVGSGRYVYCLDAADGTEIWKTPCAKPESSGSFILVDGRVIGQVGVLTALDARTGRIAWTQPRVKSSNNSPVAWVKDGRTYLICNTGAGLFCVNPAGGKVLWQAKGGHHSTPVVAGDVLVVNGGPKTGLAAYRISPSGAEAMWAVKFIRNASSPLVYKGRVYGNRIHRLVCVELDSGKVLWNQKCAIASVASPVIADGKIYCVSGNRDGKGLLMIGADPRKFALLGEAALPIARCSSPTIVAGRAYLRLRNAVACFALTAPPSAPTAAAHTRNRPGATAP
jgi:outer membrane protein assembly factor BamB